MQGMKYVAQIDESGEVTRFIDDCEPNQVWSTINAEVKERIRCGEPIPRFAIIECKFTPGKYITVGGTSYQRKIVGIVSEFDLSVFPASYRRCDSDVRQSFNDMLRDVTR